MKVVKPLLLSFSLFAFAAASAYADDAAKQKSETQAKPPMSQSEAKPSGSASGGASAGAGGSTAGAARMDFDKADTNKDGQLSRAEFDAMMKGSAAAGASAKKDKPKTSSKMEEKPATTK